MTLGTMATDCEIRIDYEKLIKKFRHFYFKTF